ncbi:hypothetical protein GCM10025777_49310 [Membranihabitans marinus]
MRPSASLRARSHIVIFWLTVLTAASRTSALLLALPWLALQETGSATIVGALGALTLLAGQLLAPLLMLFADRLGRWRTAVAADVLTLAGCGAAALLVEAGMFTVAAMMVLGPLLAIGRGVGSATRKALVPDLAEEHRVRYSTVTAGREVMIVAGFVVSPIVSGYMLVDGASGASVFWMCVGFSLLSMVGMLLIPRHLGVVEHTDPGGFSVIRTPRRSLVSTMREHPALTRAVLMTAAVAAVAAVFQQVGAPVIAESIGDSDQLGLLIAGYALGSVAGVGLHVLAARTLGRFSTVVFGVALGVLGFALLPFLLEAGWAPGVGALVGAGLGMTNPLWATATAEYSPHHARSTVVAAQVLAAGAVGGLAPLAAGIGVEHLGVVPVMWVVATYWAGCCLLWLWRADTELTPRVIGQQMSPSFEQSGVNDHQSSGASRPTA